jgi:hypothetical protein
MEEMYEKLLQERENREPIMYGALLDPTTFVGADGVVYGN